MIVKLTNVRDTRLVTYDFLPGHNDQPVPAWHVGHPGSYAPGHEHMGSEIAPVKTARVHLIRRDGRWESDAITLNVGSGTPVTIHIEVGTDPVPFWLVQLAIRAAQEVS